MSEEETIWTDEDFEKFAMKTLKDIEEEESEWGEVEIKDPETKYYTDEMLEKSWEEQI